MAAKLIECVPNFSEGRDPAKVEAIRQAAASVPGILLLRSEMDADHNRSVITFAGPPAAVQEAAFQSIAKAAELIDLGLHKGVHPRMGAADVVPFIPLEGAAIEECARIAHKLGRRVWEEIGIPVYLYEAAAREPGRVPLENVRRGGFENPQLPPDIGGPELHPTAGACVIGARKLLIAFNVNLNAPDVEVAREIAVLVRASSGGYPNVKAMGVMLASRGIAQVSMNLTDFEVTPPHVVYDRIVKEASARGVSVAEFELVGLIPRAAAVHLDIPNGLILENRIAEESAAGR